MQNSPAPKRVGPNACLAAPTGHQRAMFERKRPMIETQTPETMRKAHQMAMKAEIEIVDMNKYVSSWAKPSIAKWDRGSKKQYTLADVVCACVVGIAFACAVFYSI